MRPTQSLLSGDGVPLGKYNKYYGHEIGAMSTPVQKQRGIITWGVASNYQNPLAGTANAAVFNTWRRFSKQVLYVVPPLLAGYYLMQMAVDRNHYLMSKAGRAETAGSEE